MSDYEPYNPSDLQILINEPWEISDQPYKLHAAYAVHSLFESLAPREDDDELDNYLNYWGWSVPKKILDRLIIDIAEDFNDAAANRKTIRIKGKNYSIRKVNAYDYKRLIHIFNFPIQNGEYLITPEGIMNLYGPIQESLKQYEVSCENSKANRNYVRQIICLAEDDSNNGWDKLTDMEIVLYCWSQFYNKEQTDNFVHFLREYKDYVYVTEEDIRDCLDSKSLLRGKPVGMYPFSFSKVQDWNQAHNQISHVIKIPIEEAEDYWYSTALKTTFKPLN